MRLHPKEVEGIIDALSPFIGANHAELRLYGSRVRDDTKGGDIDLLLLTDSAHLRDQLLAQKHYLLASIKNRVGDQKIDLLIADLTRSNDCSFLNMVLPGSICLKTWKYPAL